MAEEATNAAGGMRPEVGACFVLFPNIVELVGASVPSSYPVDGQNPASPLAGRADPRHRDEFLSHYPHLRRWGRGNDHVTLYRRGDWKVNDRHLDDENRYELYDLASDPNESHDLAAKRPGKLKSMTQGMIRELESMEAVYPVKDGRQVRTRPPAREEAMNDRG